MAITAQEVNKLRKETGAGMMDCKKALTESNGDFQAAIDLLRKKGQKVSAKRADRETSEGGVFTSEVGATGYLVALGCETDFVAKNEDFLSLGGSLLELVKANDIDSVESLLESDLNGQKVNDVLTDYIGKIGEKIAVVKVSKVTADCVVPYVHSNNKLGVLVALQGANNDAVIEAGKDVAMQIAAMNPVAVDESGIDSDTIAREIEIGKEQAIAEGKPAELAEKIAKGKLGKFYKDNTLLKQQFVKDNKKSVEQMLKDIDPNLTVTAFERVLVG